jgi:hypothetical protein
VLVLGRQHPARERVRVRVLGRRGHGPLQDLDGALVVAQPGQGAPLEREDLGVVPAQLERAGERPARELQRTKLQVGATLGSPQARVVGRIAQQPVEDAHGLLVPAHCRVHLHEHALGVIARPVELDGGEQRVGRALYVAQRLEAPALPQQRLGVLGRDLDERVGGLHRLLVAPEVLERLAEEGERAGMPRLQVDQRLRGLGHVLPLRLQDQRLHALGHRDGVVGTEAHRLVVGRDGVCRPLEADERVAEHDPRVPPLGVQAHHAPRAPDEPVVVAEALDDLHDAHPGVQVVRG